MPKPRKQQICLEATPYYHCVSRCVRRAFLCGEDHYSGQSYEHRRGWVEERLLELTCWFSIDLCAYAIMSNHFHVVLHVDVKQAERWTTREIVERWHGLFAGNLLSQRFLSGHELGDAELRAVEEKAELWRDDDVVHGADEQGGDLDDLGHTLQSFPVRRPVAVPVDRAREARSGKRRCVVLEFLARQ